MLCEMSSDEDDHNQIVEKQRNVMNRDMLVTKCNDLSNFSGANSSLNVSVMSQQRKYMSHRGFQPYSSRIQTTKESELQASSYMNYPQQPQQQQQRERKYLPRRSNTPLESHELLTSPMLRQSSPSGKSLSPLTPAPVSDSDYASPICLGVSSLKTISTQKQRKYETQSIQQNEQSRPIYAGQPYNLDIQQRFTS